MKKFLIRGLIFILIISFFTLPVTATSDISTGIIEIYTSEDLMKIGNDPDWPLDGHYILMNDLIFTRDSTQQSNFKPIAPSYDKPFAGVFDGNGKVIRGLTAQSGDEAVALFFIIDGEDAVVKNLGLEDIDFYGVTAAAIAIYLIRGLIENCYSTGKVDSFYSAGGIAANVSGKILNCYSSCRIIAPNHSGGIVGTLEERGIISRCFFSGNISAFGNVGGIVGTNYGLIERSYFSGNLDRKIYYRPAPSFDGPRGGIAGANMNTGIIINCFSSGVIEGGQRIGGIVGTNIGEITKCYSTSELKASSNSYFLSIAGIAGNNSGKVDRNISIVPEITLYINLSGRVIGNEGNKEYKDMVNLAWDEMKLTIVNLPFHTYDTSSFVSSFGEENIMNGYFISSEALKFKETYERLGWSFSGKDPIWEFSGEYAFPKLVGVGGQERLGIVPEEVLAEENIIEIYSPEDLMKIGNDPGWPLDAHYILMNDINFIKNSTQQSNFTPIPSTRENPFKGIFDGNGNVIRGLVIKNADSAAALFRYIDGENAVVKDLGLEDIDFYGSSAGGIASVLNKGSIENCYTTGTIFGRSSAGGIVTSLLGTINTSYSSCEITGQGVIGGITAMSAETGIISKCFFDGSIGCISSLNTGGPCGGIAGYNIGIIERSYFSGSVTRRMDKFYMTNPYIGAGGIAGENNGIIVNCFSIGKVTGDEYVGGIVGNNFGEITKCYSVGELGSSANSSATGIAGIAGINSGRIDKNIAAVPNIITGSFAARIMGSNYYRGSETVTNYAWGNIWRTENEKLLNGSSTSLPALKVKLIYERLEWNFSGEDPIWKFSGVYTLPKLVGVGGQEDLVTPTHLL